MERVHVPTVAYEAALERVGLTVETARLRYMNAVEAAAPHIVAWELDQLAQDLRARGFVDAASSVNQRLTQVRKGEQ